MYRLEDCLSFKASVEEENGKFYVIVLGKGRSCDRFCEFEVEKKKEFESKQACMDFFTNFSDTDYKFDEDDFLFVSDRFISIDYFGCGVDFDED